MSHLSVGKNTFIIIMIIIVKQLKSILYRPALKLRKDITENYSEKLKCEKIEIF